MRPELIKCATFPLDLPFVIKSRPKTVDADVSGLGDSSSMDSKLVRGTKECQRSLNLRKHSRI